MRPDELVQALQQYDALPSVPTVSIQLMATAPGNEHLLKLITEPVDDARRFVGRRIAFVATHGAEEVEITIPRKWLQDRGACVDLISPRPVEVPMRFGGQAPAIAENHILLIKFMENSGWLPVDRVLEDVSIDDYDAIVVPGGAWNPDQLRTIPSVLAFLKAFAATGKPLSAICHGPVVLVSAGLLRGRRVTGFWSVHDDLANAGATVLDEPVVIDGNVITGRFIYDIPQFLTAIVQQMECKQPRGA